MWAQRAGLRPHTDPPPYPTQRTPHNTPPYPTHPAHSAAQRTCTASALMESGILPDWPSPTRSMLTGSFRYDLTSFFTHLGTVAEKSMVWRC